MARQKRRLIISGGLFLGLVLVSVAIMLYRTHSQIAPAPIALASPNQQAPLSKSRGQSPDDSPALDLQQMKHRMEEPSTIIEPLSSTTTLASLPLPVREVIVFRCYFLTFAQLVRIHRGQAELRQKGYGLYVYFWLDDDYHSQQGSQQQRSQRQRRQQQRKQPQMSQQQKWQQQRRQQQRSQRQMVQMARELLGEEFVFELTSNRITDTIPLFMSKTVPIVQKMDNRHRPWQWLACDIAQLTWFDHVGRHLSAVQTVWEIEQDVGWTSNLGDLVSKLSKHKGDLLAPRCTYENWDWKYTNKLWKRPIGCELGVHRYSRRLLEGLTSLARGDGLERRGFCEMQPASLAYAKGWKIIDMSKDAPQYLGKYEWYIAVTEQEYAEFNKQDSEALTPKFYHRLKF